MYSTRKRAVSVSARAGEPPGKHHPTLHLEALHGHGSKSLTQVLLMKTRRKRPRKQLVHVRDAAAVRVVRVIAEVVAAQRTWKAILASNGERRQGHQRTVWGKRTIDAFSGVGLMNGTPLDSTVSLYRALPHVESCRTHEHVSDHPSGLGSPR